MINQNTDPVGGRMTKAAKVHNLVNYIGDKCLEHFIPLRVIAIDESTIGFKGRVSFKTYNPQKPTKWGLRVYVLADSSTSYICAFQPYYRKDTPAVLVRPDLQATSRIVVHLCEKLLQKSTGSGYHQYTDRFYTGYALALELLNMNIHLTGTVQRNRQGPPDDIEKNLKMKLHEVIAYQYDHKVMASTGRLHAPQQKIKHHNRISGFIYLIKK